MPQKPKVKTSVTIDGEPLEMASNVGNDHVRKCKVERAKKLLAAEGYQVIPSEKVKLVGFNYAVSGTTNLVQQPVPEETIFEQASQAIARLLMADQVVTFRKYRNEQGEFAYDFVACVVLPK